MWTSFNLTNGEYRDFSHRLDQIALNPVLLHNINNANVRLLILDKIVAGNADGVHQVIFSPEAYDLLVELGAQIEIAKDHAIIPQPQDIGGLDGFGFRFGDRTYYREIANINPNEIIR